MFGNGKDQNDEANDYTANEKFDFKEFRKNVSKASQDVVETVNQLDLSKRSKKANEDTKDLPDTMSAFFIAAADALAVRTKNVKQGDTENDANTPDSNLTLAKVTDQVGNLKGGVTSKIKDAKLDQKLGKFADNTKSSIKDAKLDQKAANFTGKAGGYLSGLSDNVSGSIKDAKLDQKTAKLLDSASNTFGNLTDNVSGAIKDARLDKTASNLVDKAGNTFNDVAGNMLPVLVGVGGTIAEAATNVAGSVKDAAKDARLSDKASDFTDSLSSTIKDAKLNKRAADLVDTVSDLASAVSDNVTGFVKDNKLDKRAAKFASNASDTFSSLTSSAGDSISGFVKDNKLDKRAAKLTSNISSNVKDAKLDEKLFGAFDYIPGVEVKNPRAAAKQFRKARAQTLKKISRQQRELNKRIALGQKQTSKYLQDRKKDITSSKLLPASVKQEKGFSLPWRTLGGVGLVVGGVVANNSRIWSNVPPLESKLPGEGKFYRSRQGLIFYKEAGEVTGDEHPVVFVHGIGAGAHSYEWLKNFETVSALYKTYAFDLLGFGNSEHPDFDYTSEVYIKQLTEFLDEIVGKPCYVVASSLSASFAVQVAYRRPELIDKLLLVEPSGMDAETNSGGPEIVSDAFYGLLRAPVLGKTAVSFVASRSGIRSFMQNQMFYDKNVVTDEMVEQYWISAHQEGTQYAISAFFTGRLNAEIAKTIGKLDIPILAVFGKQSRITPPQESDKVTRENKATRVKVLDNARLEVSWERADEFNSLMLDFLDNMNQTDVGTDSRVHELKISDISGTSFVHAQEGDQISEEDAATTASKEQNQQTTQTKRNSTSQSKKANTASEENVEPNLATDSDQPHAEG